MTSLLLILLLMAVTEKPLEHENTDVQERQKQNQQTPVPDAEILLFLAEWSDENNQWVDPDLFDQNLESPPQTEQSKANKNEQDPDIN